MKISDLGLDGSQDKMNPLVGGGGFTVLGLLLRGSTLSSEPIEQEI